MPQQLPAIGEDVSALMGGGPPPAAPQAQSPSASPHGRASFMGYGLKPEMSAGLAEYDEDDVMGQPIAPIPAGAAGTIVGAGNKAVSWLKSAGAQAAPALKYEAVKTGLESMGVPSGLATTVALMASGVKAGRKAPAKAPAKATASAPAAPAAQPLPAPAPQAAPATRTAPAATTSGSPLSPQRIRNEVGLEARRGKLTLSDEQYAQAEAAVKSGMSAASAVRAAAGKAAPQAPAAAATAVPARLKLNVDEAKTYVRLRNDGKTHAEAQSAIEAMRAFAAKFSTPSTDTVVRKVVDRNVSGRWRE